MKYNFDTPINRRGTDSIKWDVPETELPMWVADMDFRTAPEIVEAIQNRAAHGIFGYPDIKDDWYDAYINWWAERHGYTMQKDWLLFVTGVIPAISSIVRKLTTPGEKVLIQTPVYNVFFNCAVNNGCTVVENPLLYNREDHTYSIDVEGLEQCLKDPQVTLMILCNPQNPAGRIWSASELLMVGELAARHNVTVISDEIHCDITSPGVSYVPFASVSDTNRNNSITLIAPTKAFNLAGLKSACISIPNRRLRHKVWRAINTDEVAEPNSFASIAAVTAFTQGGQWLDEARAYIENNRVFTGEYLKEQIPDLILVPSNATYLLWIDISALGCSSREFASFLRKTTGLFLTEGIHYGVPGDGFVRLNVACPRVTLEDGLARLKTGVEMFRNAHDLRS
ncbi:cystathione beta-lyase [Ruminococcaceae bacterium YRB3002]|nr:cystathione beta-lyase [Ruminococcaceae bacterium YRB3002]